MINDRREFKRFDTLLIVDIQPHSEPSSFFFGITKNISFEGFIFESQNFNLRSGDILEFKLKHPRKDLSFSAVGEIIWIKKTKYEYLAGVKYRIIDEELKSQILKLVSVNDDVVTEQDIAKEDAEIVASEAIEKTVMTEQSDVANDSFMSDVIGRSLNNIEPEKPAARSSSGLKDAPAAGRTDDTREDEPDRTGSRTGFRDHDDTSSDDDRIETQEETTSDFFRMLDQNVPEQKEKGPVFKAAVMIAAITVVASLSFVFWKSMVNRDFSALTATDDTVAEDRKDNPEINMPASDPGLPDVSQDSRSVPEPEEIAKTGPPPEEEIPLPDSENKLTAQYKDRSLQRQTATESSGIIKEESGHSDIDNSTIDKDNNKPAPESIISEPKDPRSAHSGKSSQKAVSRGPDATVPKKETELSKTSHDLMLSDRKDNAVDAEIAADHIPILQETVQTDQKPENVNEIRDNINTQPQENGSDNELKRARIIKYSAKPRKYFLQVGAWKNPDLAKQTLSELKQDYADAYSFSKDNFQIVVIPDIISLGQGTAIANEIAKKFGLEPLLTEMDEDLEISAKIADTEIPESHIVDRSSAATDVTLAAYSVIASKPPTEPGSASTDEIKPVLKTKKPVIDSDTKPATQKVKIALAIKKPDISSNKQPSPAEKGFVRYDDFFDDNANNWDIFELKEASARIENGFYRIENKKNEGKLIILHYHSFPHNADFKFEIAIKPIHVAGNNFYGAIFGARDAFNNFSFQMNNNGRYAVTKNQGSISEELVGGHIDGLASDNNSSVVLKIAKRDNDMAFYINDRYLDQIPDLVFFGNRIGFVLEGSSVIGIDRTSSYIKQE